MKQRLLLNQPVLRVRQKTSVSARRIEQIHNEQAPESPRCAYILTSILRLGKSSLRLELQTNPLVGLGGGNLWHQTTAPQDKDLYVTVVTVGGI
jgi:hypothetical protein